MILITGVNGFACIAAPLYRMRGFPGDNTIARKQNRPLGQTELLAWLNEAQRDCAVYFYSSTYAELNSHGVLFAENRP